jgi:hypothetical protein
MMRRAFSLFAFVALLVGQVGAQADDLLHLRHDLGVLEHGEKHAPPVGHSIAVCLGYAFVCSAIGHAHLWHLPPAAAPVAVAVVLRAFEAREPRIQFLTRAPPGLPPA